MTPTRDEPPAPPGLRSPENADPGLDLDPELEERLRSAGEAPNAAPEVLDGLERDVAARLTVERGLVGWLASRRTPTRWAWCAAVLGVPALVQLLFRRRHDFGVYPMADLGMQVLLVVAAMALALQVVLRPIHRAGAHDRSPFAVAFGLGAPVLASVIPAIAGVGSAPARSFWAGVWSCFWYGIVYSIPALMVLFAVDREHHAVGRRALSAAAIGGLGANLVLLLHCSNNQAAHQLAGHASLGAFFVLIYLIAAQSRPKRSSLL